MKNLWCPLAFNGIMCKTTGEYKTCCAASNIAKVDGKNLHRNNSTLEEAFNSDFFQKIRHNLNNGIKDDNCSRCWKEESLGLESYRQKQIKKFTNQAYSKELKYVDIGLGNQCNLKCRICRVDDSSTWIKESFDLDNSTEINLREFIKQNTHRTNKSFIENIRNKLINEINFFSFFGGEPFLIKDTWNIIDSALEKNVSQNIDLMFNSNGTIWNEKIKHKLSRFKSVDLHLSIDGIKNKFNYTRHPAKWDVFYKNLLDVLDWQSKSDNVIVTLDYSVSNYNVYYIPEFIEFCKSNRVKYYFNLVTDPEYLSISNIPNNIKQKIEKHLKDNVNKKDLNNNEFKKIYGYLAMNSDLEQWYNFIKDYQKRDLYRNESFEGTFNEYFKIISTI